MRRRRPEKENNGGRREVNWVKKRGQTTPIDRYSVLASIDSEPFTTTPAGTSRKPEKFSRKPSILNTICAFYIKSYNGFATRERKWYIISILSAGFLFLKKSARYNVRRIRQKSRSITSQIRTYGIAYYNLLRIVNTARTTDVIVETHHSKYRRTVTVRSDPFPIKFRKMYH